MRYYPRSQPAFLVSLMTVDQTEFTTALLDANLAIPVGVIDPKGRPAGKRFDVYRNNVIVSLLDAMQEAFPVVHKLVGTEFFRAMCAEFVRNFPPSSPLLMFYGAEFPAFLSSFEPVAHLAYLPDVAMLEQARRCAYHAADADPIDPSALVDLAPEDLLTSVLGLHPALQIVSSPYPILSIWTANMDDTAPKISPVAETVLITRPEFDLEMASINIATESVIDTLNQGATLGDAYDKALTIDPDFDLSEAIGLLLQKRLITAITPRKEV